MLKILVIMGRTHRRLTSFCSNRVATRVGLRPRRVKSKNIPNKDGTGLKVLADGKEATRKGAKQDGGRRIMVVADSRSEAKGALQWALSQAVQSSDTIILLDVVKPAKHGGGDACAKVLTRRSHEHLHAMRNMCESSRPEVLVELSIVEGEERGATIVEEARRRGVSLLVLGQKKQALTWWLLMTWAGSRPRRCGVVEYCVQNAPCATLGVRRKSSGGYLITSKRHKDFWLLA